MAVKQDWLTAGFARFWSAPYLHVEAVQKNVLRLRRECAMEHTKITRLYKYSAFNSRSISALVTGKLWYPLPTTFNDPYDCTVVNYADEFLAEREALAKKIIPAQRLSGPADEQSKQVDRFFQRMRKKFLESERNRDASIAEKFQRGAESMQAFMRSFGVLSLSETPRSILMWSHYGGQHSGICMEFERDPGNKLGTDARKVKYVGRRTITSASNPMLEKYTGWKYEREWRVMENEGNKLYPYPGRLCSIICGARMPQQNIETISKIVHSLNVSGSKSVAVKFASMNASKYVLTIGANPAREQSDVRQ